jgi:prepilin-type N-terminal cleavage/methylation domain-containing protein
MKENENRGFSMVETMVAVVIVSVALLAMGGMLMNTVKSNKKSEERMNVAAVSQAVLSDHAAQLLAGTWNGQSASTGTQGGYNYTVTASNNNGQTVLSATLTPVSGGRVKSFTNETLVSTVAGLNTNDNYSNPSSGKSDNGKSDNGKSDNGKSDNGKSDNGKSDNKKSDNKKSDNNGKDSGNNH